VDFQAGITGILEAMAMGKSVIVSRSQGQGDTVIDRRKTTRTGSPLPTVGNLKEFFGDYVEDENIGQTGFYVTPGDTAELNRAITYLLNNPERADEMGRQGRKMVTSLMRVDQFAQRIRQIIEKETGIKLKTIQPAVKDEGKCEPSSLLS
jgi:glycosyltransferase involved in cell wall biosynthesis